MESTLILTTLALATYEVTHAVPLQSTPTYLDHPKNFRELEERIVILDDDIIWSDVERQVFKSRKNVWPSLFYTWPENDEGWPEVIYEYDSDNLNKRNIEEAMKHFEEHTCITFREATDEERSKPRVIFGQADGCYSMVGRRHLFFLKGQPIGLSPACQSITGIIIHEIGHAIGFHHEQSRSDRDKNVKIVWKNSEFPMWSNFFGSLTENNYVPYDFYSVMHYSMLGFSKNGGSTIVARDEMAQGLMGLNREGLSHMDKRSANVNYNCLDKWLSNCSIASNPCRNYGFINRNCTCVCPPGTSGEFCQDYVMSYNDALKSTLLPQNEVISEEKNITSIGYPILTKQGERYTKRIEAPSRCSQVVLTFNDFDLSPVCITGNMRDKCCMDGLEIRTDGEKVNAGEWFCGRAIAPGTSFTSVKNVLIFFFIGHDYASFNFTPNLRGYHATISFKHNPNCS